MRSGGGGRGAKNMSPIDRSAHLNRWRHRSLIEKAVLAIGLLVLTVTLPPFPASGVAAVVMIAATLGGAGVPVRLWLASMAAPTAFLVMGAAPLLVQVDARGLALAPGGLALAARLSLRAAAGLTCLLFLALTTPASDLIAALRRAGVPAEVAEIALLIYRFLFVLGDAAAAMNAAQAARLGHGDRRRQLVSLGSLIANLLPRALDRARRLDIGLAARGWDGELRVLETRAAVSPVGLTLALGANLLVGAVEVWTW